MAKCHIVVYPHMTRKLDSDVCFLKPRRVAYHLRCSAHPRSGPVEARVWSKHVKYGILSLATWSLTALFKRREHVTGHGTHSLVPCTVYMSYYAVRITCNGRVIKGPPTRLT